MHCKKLMQIKRGNLIRSLSNYAHRINKKRLVKCHFHMAIKFDNDCC